MTAWVEEAFGPVEARYRQEVLANTWGHLAPKRGLTYPGRVVFTFGVFDSGELNPTVIACDFEGLDDSPWFYEHLNDWLDQFAPGEAGRIYEWTGTFKNYRFRGRKPRQLLDVNVQR